MTGGSLGRTGTTILSRRGETTRSQHDNRKGTTDNDVNGVTGRCFTGQTSNATKGTTGHGRTALSRTTRQMTTAGVGAAGTDVVRLRRTDRGHHALLRVYSNHLEMRSGILVRSVRLRVISKSQITLTKNGNSNGSDLMGTLFTRTRNHRASTATSPLVLRSAGVQLTRPLGVICLSRACKFIGHRHDILRGVRTTGPSLPCRTLHRRLNRFLFFKSTMRGPTSTLDNNRLTQLTLTVVDVATVSLLVLSRPAGGLSLRAIRAVVRTLGRCQNTL